MELLRLVGVVIFTVMDVALVGIYNIESITLVSAEENKEDTE